MKIHEIREMKNNELSERIAEEEKNLVDLRFAHQLKQLSNTSRLRELRKDIAKMKTVLNERLREEKKVGEEKKEGVEAK